MLRRILLASVLTILAALALIRPPANGDDLVTIRMGITTSAADAPLYVADRLGYFRDEGLKLDFLPFRSGETMLPPLAAGQLDAAGGAPAAGLYNAVARGLDVKLVADLAGDPPGYGYDHLLVRSDLIKSGRFKTIKDLKGMTIASVAKGSTAAPLLAHLLAKAGLKLDDVKRQYLGFPEHVVALQNGAIDASMTIEPFSTFAVNNGAAQKIIGNDEFYPNQEISVIMFGGAFIKNHRDLGLKFMRAFLKGARFYNDALANGKLAGPNADVVIKILAEETKASDPALFAKITPSGTNPDGHVFVASLRDDLAFFKSQGLIEGNVSVDAVLDDSFATEAVRQLGPYKRRTK